MPSLSQTQSAKFRQLLKDRDMELRKRIHSSLLDADDKTYAEVAGRVLDTGEQSVADVLADFQIAELQKEVAELADVEAALRRITDGTYGECLDCGEDIDSRRLEVYPTAKRCTECQARKENIAKDTTPSL